MSLSAHMQVREADAVVPFGGLRCMLKSMAAAGEGDRVTVGQALGALGSGGIAGALLIVALIALSPATAVIGVASLCGLTIAFLTSQLLLQRKKLWLPKFVCTRGMKRSHLSWVEAKLGPALDWIERRSTKRLTPIMRWPLGYIPGAVTLCMGLAMPFLELVPLSASTIGASITLMVIGLLLDDGLIVVLGLALSVLVALLVGSAAFNLMAMMLGHQSV